MNKLNIYKRKDGRYEGRIYLGKNDRGGRIYHSIYGSDEEEVKRKYQEYQQGEAVLSDVTKMTVKELVCNWLNVMSLRVRESTLANYRMKAEKHIITSFGDNDCCSLRGKDIYAFISRKQSEGLSIRYISDIIVMIKSLIKYAHKEYGIYNVIDGIIMPKKPKAEVQVLEKQDQEKLKTYISVNQNRTTVGIALDLSTGVRIGELCAIRGGSPSIIRITTKL